MLTLTPDFPPSLGGIQILLERLLEHLPHFEHRVVARAAPGPDPGIDVMRTRASGARLGNAELNARALAVAARWRPDVVLAGHVVAGPAALAARRLLGIPYVFVGYADELTHRPTLTRRVALGSARTITISRYTAGLLDVPSTIIAPGFDPIPVERDPAAVPTILTVARLADRYKGHDRVLEAMPRVLARVPDARWLVVGEGPLRGELEDRARALGVSDSVRFLGRVDDERRAALLAEAWVFVMPSRLPDRGAGGEGFGIVYLEAASAGVPVVAGAVAGALDAVDDGVTGLLIDPTDPGAIADALLEVLTDRTRARGMSEAGRRWAAGFGWDKMADGYDEILRSVF